jgi:hypothetical protein
MWSFRLDSIHQPEDVENRLDFPNKIQHDVIVPASWTPKMYLGELSRSLSRYPMISLSLICINGKNYKSLNDVHLFFSEQAGTAQEINTLLMTAGAYIQHVSGGCHY